MRVVASALFPHRARLEFGGLQHRRRNERENREITQKILQHVGKPESLIKPVADRTGHDRRYSISTAKLNNLGFRWHTDFDEALDRTVRWYISNEPWWRAIKERSAEYKAYYAKQYGAR